MGEFKHGSMDTTEQEKTFAGLIKASILVCVVSAVATFTDQSSDSTGS